MAALTSTNPPPQDNRREMMLRVTSFRLWGRPGEESKGRPLISFGPTFSVVTRCRGGWTRSFGIDRWSGWSWGLELRKCGWLRSGPGSSERWCAGH